MHPTLSIVILTRVGGDWLNRCLAALSKQTRPADNITVVANGGETFPLPVGVERLLAPTEAGFAEAANIGLARHPGTQVLLNDDTEPAADFLAALCAAAETHGEGVYQPRILLADDKGRIENTGHALFPDGFNLARARGQAAATPTGATTGAFSGAAVMFTPSVLATVGLFDEDLHTFGEDLDLSLRILRHGFEIHHVPTATTLHALGATWGRTGAKKVFLAERNRMAAAVRSLPNSALATMPVWVVLRAAFLGQAALSGTGPGAGIGSAGALAAMAGGAAGLTTIPRAWRKRRIDQLTWTRDDRAMWAHLWEHRPKRQDMTANITAVDRSCGPTAPGLA